MTKKHVVVFTSLALTAFAAYAASVPNLFSAGDPARAADVNANFTALANAVTTLETKVAALENTALAAADVPGTYKFLSLATVSGSLLSTKKFASGSKGNDGTFTFLANGTFTATVNHRSNEYSGKAQDCTNAQNSTGTSAPGTDGMGSGQHSHSVVASVCDQNSTVFTSAEETSLDQSGTGTWVLGPAANTLTVTFPGDPPFTIFMSKRGGIGYSSDATSNSNGSAPGREFKLAVYVKQ